MEFGNIEQLYQEITQNYQLLDKCKNLDDKVVHTSYIFGLYKAINDVSGKKINPCDYRLYGEGKEKFKTIRKMVIYNDYWKGEYILNKYFHQKYVGNIYLSTNILLQNFQQENIIKPNIKEFEFNEREFYEIISNFMNHLGLEEFYKRIVQKGCIFSIKNIANGNLKEAYTLFNPITKQANIFIKNFDYSTFSMFRFIHEIGHVYYFYNVNFNSKEYLKYSKSYYKEVMSKLFEKLFLDYVIANDIRKEAYKIQLFNSLNNHSNFFLFAYAYSFLDDDFLFSNNQSEKMKHKQFQQLSEIFTNKSLLNRIVYHYDELEARNDYIYSYGDIISLFLKEDVEKEGLIGDKINKLYTNTKKIKLKKYLLKNEMLWENYISLYQKQLKLMKK